MECSDNLKESKGSQDLASGTPRSEDLLHSGSGLSQTSSHVDQIISAFEQITAQQPHPKHAAAEGGNQSSNAVKRFSNTCMLSHPACASPLLSACREAVGTINFEEASQDPAKHSEPIVQPVEASTSCTAHRRQVVEVYKAISSIAGVP